MLPRVEKRAMSRLVSDTFKKIVVNHLCFQNHITDLLQTQLTRPMLTIKCYQVTCSLLGCTAREARSHPSTSSHSDGITTNTKTVGSVLNQQQQIPAFISKIRTRDLTDGSNESHYISIPVFSVSWVFWGQNWASIKPCWPCCSYSSVSLLARRLRSWQCWTLHSSLLVLCLPFSTEQILEYWCNYSTE